MVIFEYVLILLAAVLLSNLINRFVPMLSVPVLQLVLGVMIGIIPFGAFGFEFELEPELFFVLFIAPVIFHTSMTADKKTLWELKGPITASAVVLVIITVLLGGFAVHAMIPAIPLAGAFALISALGPTDYVAVDAVEKRVHVPRDIMTILSGEAYINDASGIVCFQFAVAATLTGAFSPAEAVGEFLLVAIGGIIAGLALTFVKYGLVRWLRSQGIENATLHILIGLLTPFIIYIAAEEFHVSGILAVFASGIAHSFAKNELNPEIASINTALDNVWSVVTFTFEGLVFVILGTQLPGILAKGGYMVYGLEIFLYIAVIVILMAVLRVLWWIIINDRVSKEEKSFFEKIKSGVIYALAGARGTVSLASAMAIPLVTAGGTPFPARDLIILLVSGVIVVSLLITNFILPKFTEQKADQNRNAEEQEAYLEIVKKVTAELLRDATAENRAATEVVVRSYYTRNVVTMGRAVCAATREEAQMQIQVLLWEKENTENALKNGTVDETIAEHFIEVLNLRIRSGGKLGLAQKVSWFIAQLRNFKRLKLKRDGEKGFRSLINSNALYVLKKLKSIRNEENAKNIDGLIASYELNAAFYTVQHGAMERTSQNEEMVYEIAAKAFAIERGLIHDMFEEGRISRESAKDMRTKISGIEATLQTDQFAAV